MKWRNGRNEKGIAQVIDDLSNRLTRDIEAQITDPPPTGIVAEAYLMLCISSKKYDRSKGQAK